MSRKAEIIIQAVLRCKRCGKFINFYHDQFKELFNSDANEEWWFNIGYLPSGKSKREEKPSCVVKCKCPGAIFVSDEIIESFIGDEKYENFFLYEKDTISKKKDFLVGTFFNTTRKKEYFGIVSEADNYHISQHCRFDGPQAKQLMDIKELMLKERCSTKYAIEDSLSIEDIEKLKRAVGYN